MCGHVLPSCCLLTPSLRQQLTLSFSRFVCPRGFFQSFLAVCVHKHIVTINLLGSSLLLQHVALHSISSCCRFR
jgi:hypothetical protein